MGTFRLRIGFPETTPVSDAISQAIADWHEACERAGWTPAGGRDLSVTLDTSDPDRTAQSEYIVAVAGEVDGYV